MELEVDQIAKAGTTDLPTGWKSSMLKDVAVINPRMNDKSLSSKDIEVQFVPMKLVDDVANTISLTDIKKLSEVQKKSYTYFADGDILFAKVTPCMENGKVAVAKGLKNNIGFGSSEFYVIRCSSIIDNQFLFYYLLQERFRNEAEHSMTGTAGLQRVPREFLENYEIPLPPLDEQKLIVAKLDAILPAVKKVKARLEKIPGILKKFRQSVLSAACGGRLTEEWRFDNLLGPANASYDIPSLNNHAMDVPDEWQVCLALDVCETVACGSTPKGKPFTQQGDIPYLKVYNIVDQKIAFDYKPQFISRSIHENELKRCKGYPGDVLMNIVGPPLGKIAILPEDYAEWNMNQALVLFRPKEFLSNKFLYIWLCSQEPIKEIMPDTRGSAGQVNISLTQARNLKVPVPTIEEQGEIVRRVESLFAIAEKLEERYHTAMMRVEKIEQGVLGKAFRGELV